MDAGAARGGRARGGSPDPSVAVRTVSVFGPGGSLDLVVPDTAPTHDLARAYAEQAGLAAIPLLFTTSGISVRPDLSLAESGLETGSVLVASPAVARRRAAAAPEADEGHSSSDRVNATWLWLTAAAAVAGLGAWLAIGAGVTGWRRDAVLGALAFAGLTGVLPWGRRAAARAVVAPAFVLAAVLAAAWSPEPEARPLVVAVAVLSAAAAAALARALTEPAPEGLVVWMWTGVGFSALAAGCELLGLGAAAFWSLALLAAALATRLVPALAVDVPDQLLIDLERLAVTAWSARERPRGRRARTLVPASQVEAVAARGGRIVTAASAAIAVTALVSARELVGSVHPDLDRTGARWLVLLSGAVLLLAARSHRHRAAQVLLRLGGLGCWALVAQVALAGASERGRLLTALACVGLAAGLVVAAVATGRGWRSAWWGRRAEVAEALAGALAIAAVVVSTGLFRHLWEIGSTMFRG